MDSGPNNSQVQMSACRLCGDCATGCNFGAKDSLDVNLLVEAKRRRREAIHRRNGIESRRGTMMTGR